MKKIVAMVVLMVMAATMMVANAEVVYNFYDYVDVQNGDNAHHYYVTAINDGTTNVYELSQSDWTELKDQMDSRNAKSDRGWFRNAIAWCSFWNPND